MKITACSDILLYSFHSILRFFSVQRQSEYFMVISNKNTCASVGIVWF